MLFVKKTWCLFVYLVIFHSCLAAKKTLPVFLLDYENVMSHITLEANPLAKLNENFFSDLVYDAIKRSDCVIIFADNTLCTEDLSLKDRLGTAYYYLQKGVQDRKVMYLPGVLEPYELLSSIFEPVASNIFHLGQGKKLHLLNQYKYIYVYFADNPDTTRIGALRKHDAIMKEVYFAVRQLKAGPIVAFYTGKVNPINLEQIKRIPFRSKPDPKEGRGFMIVTPHALLRLNGVTAIKKTVSLTFDEMPTVVNEFRNAKRLWLTIEYSDFHLLFFFQFQDTTWTLAQIRLLEANEEVGRITLSSIYAPWERSYYCAEPINIINKRDGSSVTISEYQTMCEAKILILAIEKHSCVWNNNIHNNDYHTRDVKDLAWEQVLKEIEPTKYDGGRSGYMSKVVKRRTPVATFNNGNMTEQAVPSFRAEQTSFSRPITCGPYFNIVILSAQMIFLMFFLIMMWGIVMLFNCAGNSKFDDPNQKPLVIAQEAG